jgi:hypothetical protein
VWLRHFQAITDQGRQEPLPVGLLLEWIEADVALCVKLGLPAKDGAALVNGARARIAALGDRRFAVVGQHPDYQPDNVLVSPGGVTVLDFTSFQHAPLQRRRSLRGGVEFLSRARSTRGASAASPRLPPLRGRRHHREPAMAVYLIQHMVRAAGRWVLAATAGLKPSLEWETMRFLGWWRAIAQEMAIDALAEPDRSSGGEPPLAGRLT